MVQIYIGILGIVNRVIVNVCEWKVGDRLWASLNVHATLALR